MTTHVLHIESDEEYTAFVSTKEKRIIKTQASWCQPCKRIAPYFEQLSGEYKNADFISLDVDDCPDTSKNLSIRALPTFVILQGNKEVARLTGADQGKLNALVKSHLA